MDLQAYAGLGGIPIVLALVEGVKRTFPDLEPRWYPLVALVLGVGISEVVALLLGTDLGVAGFTGLLSGLSASGLYGQTKPIREARATDRATAERIGRLVPRG